MFTFSFSQIESKKNFFTHIKNVFSCSAFFIMQNEIERLFTHLTVLLEISDTDWDRTFGFQDKHKIKKTTFNNFITRFFNVPGECELW